MTWMSGVDAYSLCVCDGVGADGAGVDGGGGMAGSSRDSFDGESAP
jgi:hypothetical protein